MTSEEENIETLPDEMANETSTNEISLEEEIMAARSEIETLKDSALRLMAEAENIRKRAEREKTEARLYAIDKFARDLLPVADTFGRALSSVSEEHLNEPAVKSLFDGLSLTEKELFAAFERHGLTKIGLQGEKFDPNLHQAVAQIPSAIKKDHIAEVFQHGFILQGRVLRAAMVAVSAGETN